MNVFRVKRKGGVVYELVKKIRVIMVGRSNWG